MVKRSYLCDLWDAMPTAQESVFWFVAAIVLISLLVLGSSAFGQGLIIVNGRATPQVIVGDDGCRWPVAPGPQYAGPSPVIMGAPWCPPPARRRR